MERTFEGVRVLDFTQVLAGPFAGMQLALLGADVIKIEQPRTGDQGRHMVQIGGVFQENQFSGVFMGVNPGKRSITLDLKHPDKMDVLRPLVESADVVLENFKAGQMVKLGIGPDVLRAINPRLIFCSVSGYGQTGPRAGAAAYDVAIQAASGMMAMTGTEDSGPLRTGYYPCDMSTGMTAAFAIAGALFKRTRTGEGAYIDVSMLDTAAAVTCSLISAYAHGGLDVDRIGNRSQTRNPLADSFETADGWIMMSPVTDGQSNATWRVLGRPELADDPDFGTLAGRKANAERCRAIVRDALATDTTANWEKHFGAAGVPCSAIASMPEFLERDEQAAHRGIFRKIDGPASLGREITYVDSPFKLSGEATGADRPPPLLGEHTDEVLGAAGFDAATIARLREAGVI